MKHPLYLAVMWHMHQPYYRDLVSGQCTMPWVRLHAAKDYLDMVKRLEAFPNIHQTFNLVPSLIDQLEEYLPPTSASDQFLDLSRKPAAELTEPEKRFLLKQFFMANWDRMVKPHARYGDLLVKRGLHGDGHLQDEAIRQFRTQDFLDLQVWFNLVWIDPWLRQQDPLLSRLEGKGSQFTEEDKQALLARQLALLAEVIPTYRAAMARGQIELTTTPYYHPILPLLCDARSAQVALPRLPLPEGGYRHPEDARAQLEAALKRHEAVFGTPPSGLWPAEGSISEEAVELVLQAGVRWLATDEEILWRTLRCGRTPELLYRPHPIRRNGRTAAMIFRDHELSDLMGFVYSQWKPQAAIQDFLKRLEALHERSQQSDMPWMVSIILDGENAWEFYEQDGHPFLTGLYEQLAHDARFRVATVSECLEAIPIQDTPSLPELHAGSWIDANFATWIGQPEKNQAWVSLERVRNDLVSMDQAPEPAWRSFHAAEGSDWMWWFGDTHSSAQDDEFDRLFRVHLANVYRLANQPVPEWLHAPITQHATGPTRQPTAMLEPVIDGRETSYYEWLYAGHLDLRKGYAAMHRGSQILQDIWYGFDRTRCYLRLDAAADALRALPWWHLDLQVSEREWRVTIRKTGPQQVEGFVLAEAEAVVRIDVAWGTIIELALPRELLGADPGQFFRLMVALSVDEQAEPVERHPAQGAFHLPIPRADLDAAMWSV